MSFQFIDHTADAAAEITANSLEELFTDAAESLFELMQGPARTEAESYRSLALESEDLEALLVDFLNELIFLFDSEELLPTTVDVLEVSEGRAALSARVGGVPLGVKAPSAATLEVLTEVKAATYHDLRISRRAQGFHCCVVYDL